MDPGNHLFPLSVTNAVGETTTSTWDELCATPASATDANGQTTTTQYDALCRVIRRVAPLGAWETTAYLDLGNPQLQRTRSEAPSPTGAGSAFSQAFLDGFGRAYRTEASGPTPAQTIVAEAGWNARGAVAWTAEPRYAGAAPVTTTVDYDALDRPTYTHLPDGNVASAQYGAWSVVATDPLGHWVSEHRDAFGRTVRIEEEDGQGRTLATTYGYGPSGDLTSMTDAAGNNWTWSLDSVGRLVSRNDPDAGVWTFAYDVPHRKVTQTDANGQTTETIADPGWRPLQRTTSGQGGETTTWGYSQARTGYSNAGRLTTMTDAHGQQQYAYDALGRPVLEVRTLDGVDYVLHRRFSTSGQLAGVTFPDGEAIGTPDQPIVYDGAGRVSAVPGFVTAAQYDALGQPTWRQNANGSASTWQYHPQRGWLTGIQTTAGSSTVQDLAYTLNALGRVTQVSSPVPDESWSYEYDVLGRLIQATNLYVPAESQSFQYDSVGNKTYDSRLGSIGYPPVGSPRPHAPQQVGGGTLLYDGNGNLMSGRGRAYTWNVDNLPTQINGASFLYSGDGSRLKKASDTGTSLYPVGSYEVRNGVVTKYVSLPGLGTVAKRTAGQTFWLHSDRLGSVQAVTDASGAVVKRQSYRPYGQPLSQSGTHWEPLGYIGERFDDETGLQYLNARYYDAELGAFASADPLEPFESGVMRYGYADGDPINLSDPSGLEAHSDQKDKGPLSPTFCEPDCDSTTAGWLTSGLVSGHIGIGPVEVTGGAGIIGWLVDLLTGGGDDSNGGSAAPPGAAPPSGTIGAPGPVGLVPSPVGGGLASPPIWGAGGGPAGPVGGGPGGGTTVPGGSGEHVPSGRSGWGTAGGELNPLARQVIADLNQWNLGSNLPKLFGIPAVLGTAVGTFEIAGGWAMVDAALEITSQRMMHVMARHTFGGAFNTASTSTFFAYLTRADLRQMARLARFGHAIPQGGGRIAYVASTGGLAGIDRWTVAPTSYYTLIAQGDLMISMFPGLPR